MKKPQKNNHLTSHFKDLNIRLGHIRLAALANISLPKIEVSQTDSPTYFKTLDSSKRTLIFLHGFLDNAHTFAGILPAFKDEQCIAIDLAGHGHSQHRSVDAHYHLADFAYDLHVVISTLDLKNVVLIGHSLGAIVSAIYASTQPPVLKGYVCIESCGPLTEDESTTAMQLTDCFVSRMKANQAIKQPSSMTAIVKARTASGDLGTDDAEFILSRNLHINENSLTWRTDKRLRTKSPFRMTEGQAQAILKNINCPRIVILGDDGFAKVKDAISLRQHCFDGVPIVSFAGKHYVHIDSSSDVAACIQKYMNLWS